MRRLQRDNTYYIILEGIAYTVVLNLYNPFVQMFAKRMGAQNIHIALLNSLPPLVAVFVLLPLGMLIEKINRKKKTTIFMILLTGLFYLGIVFVPFLPDGVKVISYVLLIGLMNCPGALYLATWQSFFADIFHGGEANRVYSLRSKYGGLFGLLTVLLTGLALTALPRTDGQRMIVYQAFYFLCFLISLLQIWFLSHVGERNGMSLPKTEAPAGMPSIGLKDIREMFANKGFVIYCVCVFLFHITWQMGWPLFFIYNVDYARLNEFQLGILNVSSGLTSFLTFSFWNRLIEKKGSRAVIIFGTLGLALNPIFYFRLFGFYYLVMVNIFSGVASACFTLALFAGLLDVLPQAKKTMYTAVFNTFINISGFISPLIGVWIYGYMSIYHTMVLIGCFRFLAVGLFALRWAVWKKQSKKPSCTGA